MQNERNGKGKEYNSNDELMYEGEYLNWKISTLSKSDFESNIINGYIRN